jgi:hypothetical protein
MNESSRWNFWNYMSNKKEVFNRLRKYVRIDAALFIASMLGAFTLSGYAYLEKYYLTLDVPIEQINITTQQILVYGAARLTSYLSFVAGTMALLGAGTFLLEIINKPDTDDTSKNTLPTWFYTIRERIISNLTAAIFVALICLLSILLTLAWYSLIRWPSDSGRDAALQQASECIERRFTYANLDEYRGCQVAESNDMLYLIKLQKCDRSGVSFETLALPKQGLESIKTESQFYSRERPEKRLCPRNILIE